MTKGTIRGRESFIANLSSRLGRSSSPSSAPDHPFRGAPQWYKETVRTPEEKLALFTDNWTALTGQVLIVEASEARERIGAWLRGIAAEHGVTHISRWEHEGLKALGLDEELEQSGIEVVPWVENPLSVPGQTVYRPDEEAAELPESNWAKRSELLKRTERCQLGIVWPDFAVANTGTLVLQCSPRQGRSVSLLTDILFAVFRADQLVNRMGEAFERIVSGKSSPLQYASSLNLITGPSRSADIENDLTIGIHGPGKVYAVIIR